MLARLRELAVAIACLLSTSATRADLNPAARHGRFQLLTYNVAGLPEGLSLSHPIVNLPVVGKLLNSYDLALVQEDFAYPLLLRQKLQLPYSSPAFVRGQALHFGDGLSQFGKLPFADTRRVAWRTCHGVIDSFCDCLTPKGLAMIRVEVTPGAFVDVYNLHMDAGAGALDGQARAEQLAQLMGIVREASADHAVIVAGDFNVTEEELGPLYAAAASVKLTDVCAALHCPEPWRIDRVLFRDSPALRLQPRSWRVDRSFRDARGQPLSDHLAVAVAFEWATITK